MNELNKCGNDGCNAEGSGWVGDCGGHGDKDLPRITKFARMAMKSAMLMMTGPKWASVGAIISQANIVRKVDEPKCPGSLRRIIVRRRWYSA